MLSQICFFLNILEWNGVVMFLWDSPMYSQYLKYNTAIVARRAFGSKIHSELPPVLQWESTFFRRNRKWPFLWCILLTSNSTRTDNATCGIMLDYPIIFESYMWKWSEDTGRWSHKWVSEKWQTKCVGPHKLISHW